MLLNIIYGGIGTGKTDELYSLMEHELSASGTSRIILLVPEQFSYTAEKTLNQKAGGQGPNRIEVLTFSRLISRHIDLSHNLTQAGKIMLIMKAVSKLSDDNTFLSSSKRTGFISSCAELFSEFRRYLIAPDDILGISTESDVTSKKLRSIAEIYKNYTELYSGDFTDSDDSSSRFSEYVKDSDEFSDTVFFIDNYSDFLPQHYAMLTALIEKSKGVHITLTAGEDEDLFESVIKTGKRLYAIGKSLGATVTEKRLTGDAEYIKSDEIRFLLNTWSGSEEYHKPCRDIEIIENYDPYAETEYVASEIISLVRDKNMRFGEIGIVCGNTDRYLHLASAVFSDYNIPYFADEKISVSMHPVAQSVLSVFDVLKDNWSMRSVFSYLRGGYIYDSEFQPVDQEEIDILENYVIKYGIKGKKAWFSDFTIGGETLLDEVIESRSFESYDLDALNALRRRIIAPFEKFLENKSRSARKIAEALFEFLTDINLYGGIEAECERFNTDGRRDESEQFKKVWNAILEVLDQIVTTHGDEVMSRESFAECIKNGLSACQISIIPSGLDRVSIGTVQKNSPSQVKALFIIGANRGAIPAEPSGCGIITDNDRIFINKALSEHGKEIAPDDVTRMSLEDLKLYRIVSAATQKLYISYPLFDESANPLLPSAFINNVVLKFPDLHAKNRITEKPSDKELLSSEKRGFYYMLQKLGEYHKDNPEALWLEVKKWYESRPEYSKKLEFIEAAAEYRRLKPKLSLEKAELLYGKNKKYSITALEQYSMCPFAYYMSRGLYAKPQETVEIKKSHLGSLIHSAVCEYCNRIENGAKTVSEIRANWEALSYEDSTRIIGDIMEDIRKKVLPASGDSSARLEYLISRCSKILKKSAENIRKSIKGGEYAVVSCEKEFEVKIGYKDGSITLTGTIDRIDVMENETGAGVRIVDYKSGSKKFSTAAIANKLDMQLVLYAQAALIMYKSGDLSAVNKSLDPRITAILYNKINEDMVTLSEDNSSLADEEIKKAEKLDGLIVLEEQSDGLLTDTISEMDREFDQKCSSDYLNVSLKKDGELKKSSQVISRKDFETITDYLKKTAIEINKSIMTGDISVSPYIKGTTSACEYCDYKQICMFDEDFDIPRTGCSERDNPIEIMERAVTEDE